LEKVRILQYRINLKHIPVIFSTKGNFGKVYRGILDGEVTVAAKSLKNDSQYSFDRQAANSFVREALRMKGLEHPNVMSLIGICCGRNMLCNEQGQHMLCGPLIILPYTEKGDLRGYLRDQRRLTSNTTERYINFQNVGHRPLRS
jgi:serine/threonine protein kinase